MEYLDLRSIDNPEEIFYAEILLSGLGAIMDVAVDISTALSEIIKLKPEISFRQRSCSKCRRESSDGTGHCA